LRKCPKNIIDEQQMGTESTGKKSNEERERKAGGKEKLPLVLAQFRNKRC
jgi:ribosome assembly protein YihI (activator of Der GTPase)